MKFVSSFNENPDHINGLKQNGPVNNGSYTPSYLSKDSKTDEVSFTGSDNKHKKLNPFKAFVISLAAALGISVCAAPAANTNAGSVDTNQPSITAEANETTTDALAVDASVGLELFQNNENIPVVSVMSTTSEGTNRVFPNIHFETAAVDIVHNS